MKSSDKYNYHKTSHLKIVDDPQKNPGQFYTTRDFYYKVPPKRDLRYIFLLYCPPTSNKAVVICPKEHTFVASISTSKMFSL